MKRQLDCAKEGLQHKNEEFRRPKRRKWTRPTFGDKIILAIALFLFVGFRGIPLSGQDAKISPSGDFNLILTGDSIIETRASVRQNDPRFMALVNSIRQADAAFTNLETTFPSRNAYPAGAQRGDNLASSPAMLKELQWMGINLFSLANNHSMDYGVQGLLDTIQVLQADDAVYAGTGENLGEARAPGYLSTPHGRIALLSCSSTFESDSPAGQARPDIRGRPGLNPLRFETLYRVNAASFKSLVELNDELKLGGVRGGSGSSPRITFSFPVSYLYPVPVTFELSDTPEVVTKPNSNDLAALTHSIRDAREQSDYVLVSIHAHEGIPGQTPDAVEIPAQFLVEFAHAAVDAGADVFVGSGPHVLRGIEIYKGKVIFYSLGNFIDEVLLVAPQPATMYERYGLGLDALPSEAQNARSDHNLKGDPSYPLFWQSVLARVLFRDGRPAEVTLTPFTLGFGNKSADRGFPEIANLTTATQILEHLQKISEPFGTKISISNGIGTIAIPK